MTTMSPSHTPLALLLRSLVVATVLVSSVLTFDPFEGETCPGPPSATMADAPERERTFIMVKPDGVQRGLVGEIVKRFEQKGFKLVGIKFTWVS